MYIYHNSLGWHPKTLWVRTYARECGVKRRAIGVNPRLILPTPSSQQCLASGMIDMLTGIPPPLRIISLKTRPNSVAGSNNIVIHRSGEAMTYHNVLYLQTRPVKQPYIYISRPRRAGERLVLANTAIVFHNLPKARPPGWRCWRIPRCSLGLTTALL